MKWQCPECLTVYHYPKCDKQPVCTCNVPFFRKEVKNDKTN